MAGLGFLARGRGTVRVTAWRGTAARRCGGDLERHRATNAD